MRRLPALLLSALVLSWSPSGDERQLARDALQTRRVADLVDRAHEFLLEQQQTDGSFSGVRGQRSRHAPVAVTALAALSLMAAGHLPDHEPEERDRYQRSVERAIDWLVDHCREDGYFEQDNDSVSRMHGQGYALLALTQVAGMYGDDLPQRARLQDAVRRAVSLIERTQGYKGGWYYYPERGPNHEGSITVCMIQALRSAKDAGFKVDTGVIDKALEYMRSSQDAETGRFRYALGDNRMTWALTAAALATLNALGEYDGDALERGFDALWRDDPYTGDSRGDGFVEYGALYAAQSYWAWRDRRLFDAWWPRFVAVCADLQAPDGSFYEGEYGRVYATAIVSLTLQVPFGYLPLFQR